ncbi:MAG: hypothetical protein KAW12_03355 [Candidatus Aminicenantes bacterium]|nr:hypothetical protein [Candidatus Aminicenantes bacterium]
MKKRVFLVTLIVFVFCTLVTAQEPPKQLLKPGDVKHFIKTFPLLEKEMTAYGLKYDAKSGDTTVPEALKAKSDFLDILKKHGWDENYFGKLGTIMMGYSSIVYGAQMKQADSEMTKQLKEIESNPNIPAAMKETLKAQLKMAAGVMKTTASTLKTNIHAMDLALIRPLVDEIKKVVEQDQR